MVVDILKAFIIRCTNQKYSKKKKSLKKCNYTPCNPSPKAKSNLKHVCWIVKNIKKPCAALLVQTAKCNLNPGAFYATVTKCTVAKETQRKYHWKKPRLCYFIFSTQPSSISFIKHTVPNPLLLKLSFMLITVDCGCKIELFETNLVFK